MRFKKVNSENFLTRLRQRDEKALEYVVEKYGGLLMSIIAKHLFCLPTMQEECMNDVLLSIWEHIEQYDETRSTFTNWIAGIARYKSIDYLRKYKKISEEQMWEESDAGKDDESLIRLIDNEISEETKKMLSCLGKEDQEIFLKLFYEEKDMEEVSREMGLKKETIYQRVSRGKKRMIIWRESKEGR